MRHDHDHELWLADVLAGEVDIESPEARKRREECAMCRESLEELGEVAHGLERLGRCQREAFDEWEVAPEPAPELQEKIRAAMRSANFVASSHWQWTRPVLVGVAAVALVGIGIWLADPSPGELRLGPSRWSGLIPEGDASPPYLFRWDFGTLPEGGWFQVFVEAEDRIWPSPPLAARKWRPSAKDVARWKPPFRWYAKAFCSSGTIYSRSPTVEVDP